MTGGTGPCENTGRLLPQGKGLAMKDVDGKTILSRDELAGLLYQYWLSLRLSEAEMQETAEQWHISTWTPELRRKFRQELVAIHTWMLADACQALLLDPDQIRSLLNSVCWEVYQHLAETKELDYPTWGESLANRWDEYTAAMTEGAVWNLAKMIDMNLFGGNCPDLSWRCGGHSTVNPTHS